MKPIKITIVTVCFNAADVIERTFASVEQQDYPAVEHLIIDGNSTDSTLELTHRYMERNSRAAIKHEINCLSECDDGTYDAMNKGLSLSTGRYVVFLNAGDSLHDAHTLSAVAESIGQSSCQPAVVYGETDIVDEGGRFLRHRRLSTPETLTWRSFHSGMLVCHQSFYVRTDLAKEQPYNLRYRFSADFDWALRLLRQADERRLPVVNTHRVLTDYLNCGLTTRNRWKSLRERFRIMTRHYGWATTLTQHAWFVLRSFLKK